MKKYTYKEYKGHSIVIKSNGYSQEIYIDDLKSIRITDTLEGAINYAKIFIIDKL